MLGQCSWFAGNFEVTTADFLKIVQVLFFSVFHVFFFSFLGHLMFFSCLDFFSFWILLFIFPRLDLSRFFFFFFHFSHLDFWIGSCLDFWFFFFRFFSIATALLWTFHVLLFYGATQRCTLVKSVCGTKDASALRQDDCTQVLAALQRV